jgi:XTP/dITP diphosphohydrolase
MGKPHRMLIATANAHKVKEFREMLGEDRFEWMDLARTPAIPVPEETGETFRANACLKAAYYAKVLNTWAMADDSGLEVDALGGKPGVHSARWAEMHSKGKGDKDNNRLLLEQMHEVSDENRTARFVCCLALANPDGKILLTARETVEGHVLREARGANGFGYDPLFYIDHMGKTTAELKSEEKHAISHRGKALRVMKKLLREL